MTIEERLENIERELGRVKRRNHWLLGAILVLLGGLVAAGVFKTMITPVQAQIAGAVKEIRANKIVLEDENGKIRASLTVEIAGTRLALNDDKGEPRLVMGLFAGMPILALSDKNGKNRAGLSVVDGPALNLWDENEKIRAALTVEMSGPKLVLNDEKGNLRFAAGTTMTKTSDGKTIEYPESSLILFGPDGKAIWSATR
jgi:hypothetical protein